MNQTSFKIFKVWLNAFDDYSSAFYKLISLTNRSSFVTINNVHTIIEAINNDKLKNAINNSFLALTDGQPLVYYAKLQGMTNICRIFGPSFLEYVLMNGQKESLSHYFFGNSQETIDKMISVIKNKFPNSIIAGSLSPPFKNNFTKEENEKYLADINSSNADIIWISLGAPKQELWMYDNYGKLKKGVMIGIGAGFDYLIGNTKHAPKWMKDYALEWIYRLLQEPKRLWKRYLVSNTLFIIYFVLEALGMKKFK